MLVSSGFDFDYNMRIFSIKVAVTGIIGASSDLALKAILR